MNTFKDFKERYCPYIQENIPVEVTYSQKGEPNQKCLNSFKCPRHECSIYIRDAVPLTLYKRTAKS